MIPRLHLRTPGLRTSSSSFNGRTPRLSSRPAATTEPKKRKSMHRGPGKHWLTKPAVIIRSGGREICNKGTPEGMAEYNWRRILMFVRQYCQDVGAVLCCVCRLPITLQESTWEHEFGRHASRIDERIWNPDTMKHQNGLSHLFCNSRRGSSRSEIFHGNNCVIQVAHGATR